MNRHILRELRPRREGGSEPVAKLADRAAWAIVLTGVLVYGLVFSLRTTAAYTSANTLFDLATYQQGFWNALGWPPFYYSLEGEMSRFGRHFSPVFYLILPLFWLHPVPPTLLAVHSFALGAGAIPAFLIARRYIGLYGGVLLAIAYLLSPAVQDINVQNDFHEIAFALPSLLLAFYLGIVGRRGWFVAALLLALSTREEVAITTLAFGSYLVLARPDAPPLPASPRLWARALAARATSPGAWQGWAAIAISSFWLVGVVFVAMPYLNAGEQFPVPGGYEHLGATPLGILRGMVEHPGVVLRDALSAPKVEYLFWLLAPLAFLPLLAPEALLVSAPALVEILISRYPPHYYVFERYTAPVLPAVILAATLGVSRLARRTNWLRARPYVAAAVIVGATIVSQAHLQKFPTEFRFEPDPHSAIALAAARRVPPTASVAVADHRLLAHLASRRELYVLDPGTPRVDYVIFDRGRPPITQWSPADQRKAEDRFLRDADYRGVTCEDGVVLLARQSALQRDGVVTGSRTPGTAVLGQFGGSVSLSDARAFVEDGEARVELTWRALGRGYADYQVFVHVVDASGAIVAQSDAAPQRGKCPTSAWAAGMEVLDTHAIRLPEGERRPAAIRVGLYDLATLARLPRTDVTGGRAADFVEVAWPMLSARP